MTDNEIQRLLQVIVAAYPAAQAETETLRLYRRTMRGWKLKPGQEAVKAAITTCSFLPSIAELVEHYSHAAEVHRREVEQERSRLERIAEDNMELPELQDIPAVQEHLTRIRAGDFDAELNLERVQDGKCFDCPNVGELFKLGSNGFCSRCVAARLRAKERVEDAA